MNVRTIYAFAAAFALAGTTVAQSGINIRGDGDSGRRDRGDRLAVGDAAPKIEVEKWVKGDLDNSKLTSLAGKPYVVEFWATWCKPCLESIPHITDLAKRYPEVTFIGVSNEDVETVEPYVARMGSKMGYNVAVDQRERTTRNFMEAARQDGIPTAFIVDQSNKIAWIGHPLDEKFEEMISLVSSGRYDPELVEAAQPLLDQVQYSVRVKEWRVAENYLDQVIAMDPRVFNTVAIDKFRILLMNKGVVDEAIDYARGDFSTTYASDTETLRMLARRILTNKVWIDKAPEKMRSLALELAEKAYSNSPDPQTASVVALANYHNGQIEKAINYQRRAYLMARPEDKEAMKRQLDAFQSGARIN